MNKSSFLLLVLTISASCLLVTPEPGLFENLGLDLDEAAQTLVDSIKNVTVTGAVLTEDFVYNVRNVSTEVGKQAAALAVELAEALHTAAIQALNDFVANLRTVIVKLQNSINRGLSREKRRILSEVLLNVESINNTVSELKDQLDKINTQLDSEKDKFAEEIHETIRSWAYIQVERVNNATNGSGKAEAEIVINELLSRYENNIHTCIEEFVSRQSQYERLVENTVSSLNNATDHLIVEIEKCLQSKTNPSKCRRSITSALKKFEGASLKLASLKEEGLEILQLGLDAGTCVAAQIADFELEKVDIIAQLDQIIAKKNETTTNASEDYEEASTPAESD